MKNKPRFREQEPARSTLFELPQVDAAPPEATLPRQSASRRQLLYLAAGLLIFQLAAFAITVVLLFSPLSADESTAAADFAVPAATPLTLSLPEPPPPTSRAQTQANIAAPVVTPSPTPHPDAIVQVRGLEITQGIQVFNQPEHPRCVSQQTHPDYIFCNNSVPLVAGRHTLLRLYLGCNGDCPNHDVTVQLRLYQAGQLRDTYIRSISAATIRNADTRLLPELRGNLPETINFEFLPPPDWLTGAVTFDLVIHPQFETIRRPATLRLVRTFEPRRPLKIAYLPIKYEGNTPAVNHQTDHWLLRMFPVPAVEYYRLPLPDLVWEEDISKSQLLRRLMFYYWFYVRATPLEQRPTQLFGWLPQQAYNGGTADPFWCPTCSGPHTGRVAFGGLRPEQDIGGPRILAHEIAHNLGAQHAWSPTTQQDPACFRAAGSDIRVDPAWPYSETPHIQEFGVDLYNDPPVIYTPTQYDMMAYCAQPWISPHTYRTLFDSPLLQPSADSPPLFAKIEGNNSPDEGSGSLLVSGLIYPDGATPPEVIKLTDDAFGLAAAPPLPVGPPSGSDYCVQVYGDSQRLAQRCFDVGFVDLETGHTDEPAAYFMALTHLNLAKIERVLVTHNNIELSRVVPSAHPPRVELPPPDSTGQHQYTVRWEAHDPDGDALTFDLFYSPDDGQRWLPLAMRLTTPDYTFDSRQLQPGPAVRLRVIAGDGFHTTVAETTGLGQSKFEQ